MYKCIIVYECISCIVCPYMYVHEHVHSHCTCMHAMVTIYTCIHKQLEVCTFCICSYMDTHKHSCMHPHMHVDPHSGIHILRRSHQCQLNTHTHTSKCSVRRHAYDHELTTPHTAAWEHQLLSTCTRSCSIY